MVAKSPYEHEFAWEECNLTQEELDEELEEIQRIANELNLRQENKAVKEAYLEYQRAKERYKILVKLAMENNG